MGIFNIFKKKESSTNDFHTLIIKESRKLTSESVMLTFQIDEQIKRDFQFRPGQYVDVETSISGEKIRRSYSICSYEPSVLSIGVKIIPQGKMSNYLNQLSVGDTLQVSNFTSTGNEAHVVFVAAGSGITPIFSLLGASSAKKQLFFVNKSFEQMMFKTELAEMRDLIKHLYFTQVQEANHAYSRLSKNAFIEEIKKDLNLLKADAFFICGPHEMILDIKDALKMFGVPESKIKFELFQATVKEEIVNDVQFSGEAKVEVTLDGETSSMAIHTSKKSILEGLESQGIDAPYSCRGGVCCSCKAKVLEGSTHMKVNYSLTDEEVKQGYILTCQAQPTSSFVKITFDE
jgi:ring-1,2-phenylacetyl-CoA epoxidase subunit PaaE